MSEYEHSLRINADPEDIFRFVADVRNLPAYMSNIYSALPQENGRVRVQGAMEGHYYDLDGFFRVDRHRHHIAWGTDGAHQYQGWLALSPEADGTTRVTVHLAFDTPASAPQVATQHASDHDYTMQHILEQTLESLKNHCEHRGGKSATVATL
jgi:uncharacterized membrane protein